MITVSIAMATYNGQRFIREQLESLAAQQHLPSELVVADDASSDETVAIIAQFARTAPFEVHVHRYCDRVGYRANFMRAASLCKSDVIAFCDQDDIWSPQKLALCTEPFRDPNVLMIYHNADVITETGEPIDNLDSLASEPITEPLAVSSVHNMSGPLGFTELFRRSILWFSHLWRLSRDVNDPTAPMAHDQWVNFIASVFGRMVYIDKVLAFYRQHAANCFGWNGPSGFQYIVANPGELIRSPAEDLDRFQQVAETCSELLEKAKCNLTGAWHRQAVAGAAQYRLLAELYAARRSIYTSGNIAERARAFYRIALQHGYRPKRNWGLGRKAGMRDLCLGVPAGALLPRRYRFAELAC
jgi:glycosyltransferase involved in cell wall biosynthesis